MGVRNRIDEKLVVLIVDFYNTWFYIVVVLVIEHDNFISKRWYHEKRKQKARKSFRSSN